MILYNVIASIALTMRVLLLLLAFTKMVNVSLVIKHFPTNLYWYEVVLVRPIPERRMSYTKLRHHLLFRHEGIIFLLLHNSANAKAPSPVKVKSMRSPEFLI